MTRNEFIEKHRHEIVGYIMDAAIEGRKGGELALWVRTKMKAIDSRLAAIFDELTAPDEESKFPRAV